MTIEFRTPTDQESAQMRDFGALINDALLLIAKHGLNEFGGVIATKLQEALFWHGHGLLNKAPESTDDSATVN